MAKFDVASAERFANLALDCIHREYPNKIAHVLQSDQDVKPPRELTPVFYGCFDWHSTVHMHWALIRLLRLTPNAFDNTKAMTVLGAHLTEPALSQEARYLRARPWFERPYGWGWALTLAHELTLWKSEVAVPWLAAVRPLADVSTQLLLAWLPKATYPTRVGMHSNSAFGLARSVPWARVLATQGDTRLLTAITRTAIQWYGEDRDYPANYEPSGSDFLSPALAEVELMSVLLEREAFLGWLDAFLPRLSSGTLPLE